MAILQKHIFNNSECKIDIWSVDRIARLVVGIVNILFLLASYIFHSYFLFGLVFVNLNLVFTSVTDSCLFKKLLIHLGAKERENLFQANGEPIKESTVINSEQKVL